MPAHRVDPAPTPAPREPRREPPSNRPGRCRGACTHPIDYSTVFPCPFCHNTTLQHYRLSSITINVTRQRLMGQFHPHLGDVEKSSVDHQGLLHSEHSAYLRRLWRADERTRTADLISLRISCDVFPALAGVRNLLTRASRARLYSHRRIGSTA